jgi:hypothetical protein
VRHSDGVEEMRRACGARDEQRVEGVTEVEGEERKECAHKHSQ